MTSSSKIVRIHLYSKICFILLFDKWHRDLQQKFKALNLAFNYVPLNVIFENGAMNMYYGNFLIHVPRKQGSDLSCERDRGK